LAPQLETLQIEQLSPQFTGELLRQGDSGYDDARLVWNGMFDRYPALIARCRTTDDVVAAVNFARESDLLIAVRGGGHSAVGYSTCDDGIVIDLSEMNQVQVDPETRIIRAGGGTTWGQFDAATQEHGLAVTGGRFSTTGIAGLTLGSGSGWLERKCGLTADSLVSAELVTADGSVIRASRDENPELFWGLKGGGGNFGVVTEFEFRGHQVGPLIYGGLMACLPEKAPEILAFMRDYMEDAPEDLGTAMAFVSAPPEPFVPPEMHFKPIIGVVICWTGSQEEGEKICAPIREVAQPVMDMVGPIPYAALQGMLDGGGPKGIKGYMKAEFMPELSDDAIAKFVDHGGRRPSPTTQLLLEPMGGAMKDVDDDDSAVGRRDVDWCYHALAMWMEPGQEAEDTHRAWARELQQDLEPHTTTGVYLNFTSDAVDDDRVRKTFGPEKYARLRALKDQYDPQNLFRLNQNIKPSAAA
jgi:FAD binding domain/Berberine and berberine like